jgi:Na+/proline symporter
VVGLAIIAVFSAKLAGGPGVVMDMAHRADLWKFLPEAKFTDIAFFVGSAVTMMLGSIPQQDVFQRVMSAKNIKAATRGPVIGGLCYILFAFVPMFLVTSALIIMPEQAATLIKEDPPPLRRQGFARRQFRWCREEGRGWGRRHSGTAWCGRTGAG